jgi:micrococcal nuclease
MKFFLGRKSAVLFIVLAALVLASAASASVRLVRVTSPVSHGSYATLSVKVSRVATCSITVNYKSGPSHAAGLYPQRGTRISWTWKVGTRTTPGRWPITVSCGSAGTLHTSFVVT